MRHNGRPGVTARMLVLAVCVASLAACAPEVGSKRWCAMMRDKARGDWTANEALDFARHCVLDDR
jgi:Protein of unknown function (DUF3012)